MATYGRVLVLAWADILAVYAMWLLMAYLTDVWRLEIAHASTIVAILWGLFALLPLFQAFLVDTLTGTYGMLFISTASFTAVLTIIIPHPGPSINSYQSYNVQLFFRFQGLGLLTMSTPPVLARSTGSCSEYKPECIGQPQKALLYTAVPLIAFGLAGNLTCCSTFIAERANTTGQSNVTWKNCAWFVYGDLPRLVVTVVAVLGIPYVNPWSLRFGIPAICTLVATLLFFSTLCSYKNNSKANGSPLTILFRVFVAAFSKLFYRIPTDPKDLFEIQNPQRYSVPHTMSLRCLDKAAIVTPTNSREEQEKNKWRLCRVTEVEETKKVVRMVPLWTTFILCGVVKAVGYTYFIEQLNHMNPKVGRLKVPLVVIIWLYEQAKLKFAELSSVVFITCLGLKKPAAPTFGIAASMILAILCCITAAKVESRRLGVVQMHGLVDKHDERVPMTMFWLLPQFLLLGAFEGVFNSSAGFFFVDLSSVQRFLSLSPGSIQRFVDQSQVSMQRYLGFFLSGVWGAVFSGAFCRFTLWGRSVKREANK
ncbi:hypothetical protein ABFS83_10G019300 [Erythranthe nasuta]